MTAVNGGKIILGLDPGYSRLGFGVLERHPAGDFSFVTCGVIVTSPQGTMPERLREIASDLRNLFQKYQPELLVVEELFFKQSTTNALKVAEVRGVIQLIAAELNVVCTEVKPVEVKMAVTGFGHADKRQMQKMITLLLRLATTPQPDDAADALAIAWTGANKVRMNG